MLPSSQFREQLIRRIRKLTDADWERIADLVTELERGHSELPQALPSVEPKRLEPRSSAKHWPHAPIHKLSPNGTFIVTSGTLHKQHFFCSEDRLDLLEGTLLKLAHEYGWQLEAWAVFSNHYHFIAHAGPKTGPLKNMLSRLHSETAAAVNQMDDEPSREVWHNFWDTELTIETSYLARLHYVHANAVKHGLVKVAHDYRWCSAAWFERTATPAQVQSIYSFGLSRVNVYDDF